MSNANWDYACSLTKEAAEMSGLKRDEQKGEQLATEQACEDLLAVLTKFKLSRYHKKFVENQYTVDKLKSMSKQELDAVGQKIIPAKAKIKHKNFAYLVNHLVARQAN